MKKKKMLRTCITSFLTGSVSIIAQAHGVVGLSDSPVASTIRPVTNNNHRSEEPSSQSTHIDRERPVRSENNAVSTHQENTVKTQGQRVTGQQPGLSGAVNIQRSGYVPSQIRPRPSAAQQASSSHEEQTPQELPTPPSAGVVHIVEQDTLATQNIQPPLNAKSILTDEMLVVEQNVSTISAIAPSSPAPDGVVDRSEPVVQSSSSNSLSSQSQSIEVELAIEQASVISPSSSADQAEMPSTSTTQALAEANNPDSASPRPASSTLNFDFQRYESAVVTENAVDDSGDPTATSPVQSISASATGDGMSIYETVQRAIEWHPSIAEALGRLYQQGEQVNVAKAGYFPQVNAGISTEHRTSTDRSEEAFTVSASQMLYDFGGVASEVKAATYGVDRDKARVWLAMDQLARDTAQATIEVQRFKGLLDIAREQIDGIDDIRELAERRSQLGASTRSDEIQAQSRLESAEATQLQLDAQLKTWENTVRTLIGANGPVNIKRDFPKRLTESCSLASEDFDNVPALMVAEAQQAEAKAIIEQAQASFFPTASVEAGFNQFLNDNAVQDDNDVTVRFNLSSNIYQGGATSARRRAADFSLQASQAARDSAYLALLRSLRQAKEQTASFSLRLDSLAARARSIRETQDLYRQQYLSLGTRSLLDLLNAEQEIHQSLFDHENTRYDLYSLQIDCLYSAADIREAFSLEDSMVQGVSVLP